MRMNGLIRIVKEIGKLVTHSSRLGIWGFHSPIPNQSTDEKERPMSLMTKKKYFIELF